MNIQSTSAQLVQPKRKALPTLKTPQFSFMEVTSTLTVSNRGMTLPWMGLALKGMLGRPLREHACLIDRPSRAARCDDCRLMCNCIYGRIFEGGKSGNTQFMKQANQSIRPLVLAIENPKFKPSSNSGLIEAKPGDELPLKILLFGHDAMSLEPALFRTLVQTGQRVGFGKSRNGVKFGVSAWDSRKYSVEVPRDFSPKPTEGDDIPKVRLELDSPIFPKPGRQLDFNYFFNASVRGVVRMMSSVGTGSTDLIEYPLLKRSAKVQSQELDWQKFSQPHNSSRSGKRLVKGFTGSATFLDVPAWCLPWMIMGGQLGTGDHRVCGAGRWSLTMTC